MSRQAMHHGDTIAAIATPQGQGAIGIVRLSGPDAARALRSVASPLPPRIVSRRLYRANVSHPETGVAADDALVVLFRKPASYTGEDVVEIHCHGGSVTLEAVLEAAVAAGCRLARPGEFTLRAFLKGRMDLAQAEAVGDLIAARTRAAADAALDALRGGLSGRVSALRDEVLGLLASLEAGLDMPDEDDVRRAGGADLKTSGAAARERALALAATFSEGRLLREGARVVLAGAPNAGKSSLFNVLLGRARAIVHPEPGTTRDFIQESTDIQGLPVTLVDTAGIGSPAGVVEKEGVARSVDLARTADLILFVLDGSEPISQAARDAAALVSGRSCLMVVSRADLGRVVSDGDAAALLPAAASRLRGCLLDDSMALPIRAAIRDALTQERGSAEHLPVITRARHHEALLACAHALDAALSAPCPEVASVCLRDALDALSDITGVTTPDDVLERVFSEFCVGK